jgi:taurine dioxygenase
MAELQIRRRGYALGAEITGVDLSRPLDDRTVAAIRQAWLDHIIIYLPAQTLSPEGLRDFAARFGELDMHNTGLFNRHAEFPQVLVRANTPISLNGKQAASSPAADHWHSDYSHSQRPSTITFLTATDVPDVGGDTMFANMYMAYDTLSPAFARMIEPLSAVHDFALSGGYARSSTDVQLQKPPVVHPVVTVHPETGRKALYVDKFVRNFVGMTEEESKPLLNFLLGHATRYEFIYRHRWTVRDLVMWDNRCALHYAVQDYDRSQLRRTLRTSLIGPKTGEVYQPERTPSIASLN